MPESTHYLATIEAETPKFSDEAAIQIARDHYDLDITVRSLVSERDQNFQMQCADGRQFVLKIANSVEDRAVTDFQIEALLHIQDFVREHKTPIIAPTVLRTNKGATKVLLSLLDAVHVARVVSFVPGVPLADRTPSRSLCRNMGVYLAHLGCALREFAHVGSKQELLWDVQRALALRDISHHIPTQIVRSEVDLALNDFEQFVAPEIRGLRRQVIHSDFNPDNVLTTADNSDAVSGVIDFGDMLEAPLVADVAIAASYVRGESGDPLAMICELLAGYVSVTPLERREVDILFDLIKARLCASIAILYWRASFRDPNDPYLEKLLGTESQGEATLSRLTELPRDAVAQKLRQVCASVAARA